MSDFSRLIETVQGTMLSNLRPEAQWENIRHLLALNPDTRRQVLIWVLTNGPGYVDVRVRAGAELLADQPAEAWQQIEGLVKSADPDDRDVALTLLAQNPSQSSYELAKRLLSDPWPYIRLAAIDHVKQVYRTEALHALYELEQHDEEWVRQAVRQALDNFA